MVLLKRCFFLVAAIHFTLAVKPPNYVEKAPDKYPPKYEYNYYVANHQTQAAQGHKEIRNGDNTRGNYFVNLPKGESKTTVNYIADEWGFYPVTRYSSRGAHHRVSGHFALGLHAVERLNETNLNTNEVFVNQSPEQQHAQLAQATFPAAQITYSPKTSLFDQKPPLNNIYAPNQPHHAPQQQQIVFQTPGAVHYSNNQQIPQFRQPEKNPVIFHHQHIPVNYQQAQQQQQQPINYYYQHNQPQEVIYQPIAPMASLQQPNRNQQTTQQQDQQPQYIFIEESRQLAPQAQPETYITPATVTSNGGNINVELPQALSQEVRSEEEVSPLHTVNENLIQVQPDAQNNVVSDNQKTAKLENDIEATDEQSQEALFQSPIVVGEQQITFLPNNESDTVVVQQKINQAPLVFGNYQPPQKQFNLQILTDTSAQQSNDQFSKESFESVKIVNGHTNSNNFQYLVEDQDQERLDSTPSPMTEAPSRQFLKKFKNFKIQSPSMPSYVVTSTSRTMSVSEGGCCKDKSSSKCCKSNEVKVLDITQRPITNTLAPVHAGVRLTNEKLDACLDDHSVKPTTAQKSVNIVVQDTRPLIYGERIIVTSTPSPIVTQPTIIEHHHQTQFVKQPVIVEHHHQTQFVKQPVIVEHHHQTQVVKQPVVVEKQHLTEIVHQPVYIEKEVIKEVKVNVDKPVYIETPPKIIDRPYYIQSPPETKVVEKIVDRPVFIKSPPETKVVHQQVIVEKPTIKEVLVPYEKTVYVKSPPETKIVHQDVIKEKPVYIEKIVNQPYEVEKIVEKPVIHTVEKIIDRPIHIEKYIDRPYPVPYAVGIPYEKPVFVKPDFHVYAKAIPHKHKLFDFDSLFGFLSKKKEVKHIFVPASHQQQLKQLNHHQLIASTFTSIDPIKESPVLDYTRYATTHLNPIKPVYGVPAAPLINSGYNYPNPYAGSFSHDQLNPAGVATIPSSWVGDNLEAQQAQISPQKAPLPYHPDSYVGPTPLSEDYWAINGVSNKEGIKFRRNVENGRSFRIEYGGFLPKISPSQEINEDGTPLKKEEST